MSDTSKRIETLEATVAELLIRMDKVDPPPKQIISSATDDEGARTFFPRITSIEMPSPEQFQQLFKIAAAKFPTSVPEFRSDWDRQSFLKSLGLAFEHICSLRRTETMNEKFYLDTWTNRASDWLRQQGCPSIETEHFFLAVIMSGDVPYRLQNRGNGVTLAFGLTTSDGIPASSAGWKNVLAREAVRPPVQVEARREHQSTVRHFA